MKQRQQRIKNVRSVIAFYVRGTNKPAFWHSPIKPTIVFTNNTNRCSVPYWNVKSRKFWEKR